MWLSTKYATKRPPRGRENLIRAELGPDTQHYKRLALDFDDEPDLAIGPDETYLDHYNRLRAAKKAQMDRPLSEADVAARARGVAGLAGGGAPAGWLKKMLEEKSPATSSPAVTDLKGMPQRIPGWFTGDAMDKQPPGYEIPLPRKTNPAPQYAPKLPTRNEWVNGLAERGIYLNPDETRMTPEQLAAPLPRRPTQNPPRGHDIWADFTRPVEYSGKHRAAKVVVAYVTRVLAEAHDNSWRSTS